MKLPIGARLPHDFADIPANEPEIVQRNRAIYRITQVLHETPWSCLYRGKKIFRNFEFSRSVLTEATDDECLDVFIRTLAYPKTDDREYIKARREHAWFELKHVMGFRKTNLIAEPLDYLEIRNDQDAFTFPRPGKIPKSEPVLVFETIDGQDMEQWRNSTHFDIPLGLRVLSQILEFLSTLHTSRLLLNVVTPSSFWIDGLHQIHCLGTEHIVDERRARTWRGLFPSERYAQGFIAPELLNPEVPPSPQSDLYGWAALAWLVLTGEHPARLATVQHQRIARFEPMHRDQLRRELSRLKPQQVAIVKQELGVTGNRFELQWPDSFLEGLWSCLERRPSFRPPSVAELRACWSNPPPPPVPLFLAIRQPGGAIRFLLSTTGLRPGLQFQITREPPKGSSTQGDREVIWSGTDNQRIELRMPLPQGVSKPGGASAADWLFNIVTTETVAGSTSHSRPTPAIAIDGTVAGFRSKFAESYAAQTKSLPDAVTLLAQVEPFESLIDELFDSPLEHVRRWSLEILEGRFRTGPVPPATRAFLRDRALLDEENEIRQLAAGLLLRYFGKVTVETTVDLAQRMGGNAVDDMIRAARGFVSFGVDYKVIETTIELLEQQHRIVVCPVCHHDLRTRELDQHLISEHRYLPIDGKLLPFGQALTRLWSRVMQQFDEVALNELTSHLQQRQAQHVVAAFATALTQQVVFMLQAQAALQMQEQRQTWLGRLSQCLHPNQIARSACWTLLAHDDARIRELARSTVVLSAVTRLVGEHVTPAAFRATVDGLVPLAAVHERIDACRQLIELGANQFAGEQCEKELELERLIDCPECGTSFPKRDLASHRRQVHQVYEWEGTRYQWETLVPVLLNRTVAVEGDAFAARTLAEVFLEKYGNDASSQLHQSLHDQLHKSRSAAELRELISGVATALGGLSTASHLSHDFLNEMNLTSQIAGLAIFSSLHDDPPGPLVSLATSRIGDRKIPFTIGQQAAIRLLKTTGVDSDVIHRALMAFASRADDGLKGIELLRTLEQWVGPSKAVDAVCHDLASRIRMRCPRCDVVMTPPDLARHVRTEHGMILEGRSVRQPWSVILECLDEYAEHSNPDFLERAEELADFMSPRKGRVRLWREALRRGIAPPHYRQQMLDSVSRTNDSLCPECWETLSSGETGGSELQIDPRGDLKSNLISLYQLGVPGIWGSVEITPWNGPVPHWSLTTLAAAMAVGLLFLIPAGLCGLLVLGGNASARLPAMLTGIAGLISAMAVLLFYRPRSSIPLDVAWEYVVPALLESETESINPAHSTFIADLCRASVDQGTPQLRQKTLVRAIELIQSQVRKGSLPISHLVELWILRLEDALYQKRHSGEVESVLNEMLAEMVKGDLPVQLDARAKRLISRLNVEVVVGGLWHFIVKARAVGLNAVDLIELCQNSTTLTALLTRLTIRPHELAYFVALTEMEKVGKLPVGLIPARKLKPGSRDVLTEYPNLLARTELVGRSSDHDAVLLCPNELIFRDRRFTSCPDATVQKKYQFVQTGWTYQRKDGGPDLRYSKNPPTGYDNLIGYHLCVGNQTWSYKADPEPLAARLRTLGRFVFGDLPILAEKLQRESVSPRVLRLLAGHSVRCPRCRTALVYQKGAVSDRTTEPVPFLEQEELV